ncbi:DOPA 4,5-dioxygenase [Vibrio sp. SCSIO 43135]|uniref:DOPA 4,5-dioxygenase family protein n=1 Tax=Vibrio sp. SCSIO 43135 TaxID=2819096 RepID=UPI002074FF43|nr:DOPA 4,5-dioxygenase family protein [Vibrio sp. SCSIO 43135]USD42777.1 DOPA 4,5-dioxygenase [Vibrio sp. SCSIO 43135]
MFHAHIYFALKNLDSIKQLRNRIQSERNDVLQVFEPVNRLVGPHKMPMMELHFADNSRNFIEWLDEARDGMSVLIHPVSDEHLLDHTERAVWLGRELGVFEEKLSA